MHIMECEMSYLNRLLQYIIFSKNVGVFLKIFDKKNDFFT